jgi:16S rRNA (guanine527-N7)-methyltransferase
MTEQDISTLIAAGLSQLGLPAHAAPVLARYETLLLEQNRSMNLTAITNPLQAAQLHILDSAALLNCASFDGRRVLDVGTGAGFPGMVLKLVQPELRLTLLDSLQKRMDWLREIAPALGAEDVCILHGRAEEYALMPEYREQFDIVTSRAVADLRVLCELCLPFVKPGGVFLAMKGQRAQEEKVSAGRCISILGGRLEKDRSYRIPGTDIVRRVVCVRKEKNTPPAYPRRFAKIRKSPL